MWQSYCTQLCAPVYEEAVATRNSHFVTLVYRFAINKNGQVLHRRTVCLVVRYMDTK